MYFWHAFVFASVESPLSMGDVLRKRYRGKLEHQETDLVETLPLSCRDDWLAVTSPAVTLDLEGSSATFRERPLTVQPITTVAPPCVTDSGHEDSKDDIISNVWRAIAKRKAVLAMRETSTDVQHQEVGSIKV